MSFFDYSAARQIDSLRKTGKPLTGSPVKADADPVTEPISWAIENGVPYTGQPLAPAGPPASVVDPLLASLDSLDTIRKNRFDAAQKRYNTAIKGYDEAFELDRANYDKQTNQNEDSLAWGRHQALLNAIRGGQGLKGVLSSLGALAGSGMDVVQRLVSNARADDQRGVDTNFQVNADNLMAAWRRAEQEDKQRRLDAKANLENEKQNARADVLNAEQKILMQLAELYGAGTAQGDQYAARASSLAPKIASTTKESIAPYAKASSLFSPAALQEYLAGTKDLNVSTSTDQTPINSPLYSVRNDKKKDTLAGVA